MRCRETLACLAGLLACLVAEVTAVGAGALDSTIAVSGNRQIGSDSIRAYFQVGAGRRLDAAELDVALKRLYASGLFQDVKIARDGERIIVKVVENPTIARVAFEGNRKIKDDELKKLVHSKSGGPLSRPVVQGDAVQVTELFRQRGYFDARIVPKTITEKSGRTALVFEVEEGDKAGVRQIRFVGNASFAANKLNGVIKTGVTNPLSFLLDNDTYNTDRIEADAELVRRFYRAHGFDDVHVVPAAHYEADKAGIAVVFTIDEGAQYRFGSVDLRSNLRGIDAAALRGDLRTQPGDVYDADAVEKTVDDLAIDLARRGEPFAAVAARSERVPPALPGGAGIINLVYAVEEGKRLYVERIDIRGNGKTRDAVIRREFDFGEGDAYNRALVDRAEHRLKALGYFKTVDIATSPGSAPDRVVVTVTVREQQTGNFYISGGYSTADGMLAQVSISDRNFLGTGDFAKASVMYGQYARGFDLAFTDPYFFDQRLAGGVDLFGKQTFANSNQAYNTGLYGTKFTLGTPLTEQLGVSWNYSIYNQSVSLDPAIGTASLPIQQAAAAGPFWVSSIGSGITYSTLDDPRNPTSGIRIQSNGDLAGLGGAAKFARTTQDTRIYHPIVGDVVGMVRTQSGYVAPWGGQSLPLLDGFFGGPQLVRGFAPNGFGPRDVTPGTTMDNVGGNVYWTTSAELQAPAPLVPTDAGLRLALFSDTGSLWANGASSVSRLASLTPAQQIANSRAVRSSVGASVIWDSMFGPLRVDYAFPIAKQPFDVTQRLNFSAGGF